MKLDKHIQSHVHSDPRLDRYTTDPNGHTVHLAHPWTTNGRTKTVTSRRVDDLMERLRDPTQFRISASFCVVTLLDDEDSVFVRGVQIIGWTEYKGKYVWRGHVKSTGERFLIRDIPRSCEVPKNQWDIC